MQVLSPAWISAVKNAEVPEICRFEHDAASLIVQTVLLLGIVISYLPQHIRIIAQKSSEGFSPWFLLLGATSASSGLVNVLALQWQSVKCCRHVGPLLCYEALGGIEIIGLQWFVFIVILVLFLIYYPPHLKYIEFTAKAHPGHPKNCECEPCEAARAGPQVETTPEWKQAITLAWVVAIHLFFCLFVTVLLLATAPETPEGVLTDRVIIWTTFLGLTSTILSMIQYTPQLLHTFRSKLVGALSIPAMAIQSPGAVLMVYTIAIKPGTNWTSWLVYAVAGILQGTLLVMCLTWKARQRRLGIDDFGNPLPDAPAGSHFQHHVPPPAPEFVGAGMETAPEEQQAAVESAVQDAVATTPLLARPSGGSDGRTIWSTIFQGR